MTNERTIDEIIKAPARETWQYGVKTSWYTLDQVNAALAAKDAEIAALKADAERMRWILDGNGYFMEHEMLCGHGPCSEEDKNAARAVIDAAMKGGY